MCQKCAEGQKQLPDDEGLYFCSKKCAVQFVLDTPINDPAWDIPIPGATAGLGIGVGSDIGTIADGSMNSVYRS